MLIWFVTFVSMGDFQLADLVRYSDHRCFFLSKNKSAIRSKPTFGLEVFEFFWVLETRYGGTRTIEVCSVNETSECDDNYRAHIADYHLRKV